MTETEQPLQVKRVTVRNLRFFESLIQDVKKMKHDYKNPVYRQQYLLRDKALLCGLILSGCRIAELLRLKWNQVNESSSFIRLINVETERDDYTRLEILMPRKGRLAPFTAVFEEWYHFVLHQTHRWHDTRRHTYYLFPYAVSGLQRHRHYLQPFELRLEGFYWNQHLDRSQARKLIVEGTGHSPRYYRRLYQHWYYSLVCNRDRTLLQQALGFRQRNYNEIGFRAAAEQERSRLLTL